MKKTTEQFADSDKRNFIAKSLALGAALPIGLTLAGNASATPPTYTMLGIINVRDPAYGAVGDGITDDTAAIQAAINYFQPSSGSIAPGIIWFPRGEFKTTAPLIINHHGIHLIGSGVGASTLVFVPSASGAGQAVIKIGGSGEIFFTSVRDLSIRVNTTTNANDSIGIYAIDQSSIVLADLDIENPNDGSIGIRIDGRESAVIERYHSSAYIPIYIGKNPDTASGWLSADHMHITDIAVNTLKSDGSQIGRSGAPTDGPAGIYIADAANLSGITIDGENAIAGPKYGIYHVDTTSTLASIQINISGVRVEQSSSDGWAMHIVRSLSSQIQGFSVTNWYGDTNCNGFYLRGLTRVDLKNVQINSQIGTLLDIDNCTDMNWVGFEANTQALVNFGKMRCVSSQSKRHDLKWPTHAHFIDGNWSVPPNNQMPATEFGTGRWAFSGTLADANVDYNNSLLNFPISGQIGDFLAIVTVAATQSGNLHHAVWVLDSVTNAVKLVSCTGDAAIIPTAGKLSLSYWVGSMGGAYLQNSLGSSCDVVVDVIYKLMNPFGQV